MSEEQIIDFLTDNIDYFVTNDFVTAIIRTIGWMFVKGVNSLIEGSKTIYNATFGLIDITRYGGIDNFIAEYEPLLQALLVLSLVVLGYMYILGKEKRHDLLTSLLIFAVVFTSSTYLFSTFNSFTIMFKDALISESNDADGYEIIRQNLYDLKYIDEQIGLINMDSSNVPQYQDFAESDLRMINISEILPDDTDGLSDDAKDILGKQIIFSKMGSRLVDVYNGVAMTEFGNTFYFRYQFHYGTYFLNAFALILLYFGLGYVNVKIIVELLRSRVLVTLFSSDLSSKKKAVRLLESVRDGYYALCFTAIELRLFMICTDYVNSITGVSTFMRSIILVFIAFTMIEGSSIAEKITGVDAGITATTHRLMGAGHAVRGAVQMGMQAKQMSTLSSMNKARSGSENAGYERGPTESGYTIDTDNGTAGMPGNDEGTGSSGEQNHQNNVSGAENMDTQRDMSENRESSASTDMDQMENTNVSADMDQMENTNVSADMDQMENTNVSADMDQMENISTSTDMDQAENTNIRGSGADAEMGTISTAADQSFAKMDSELSGTETGARQGDGERGRGNIYRASVGIEDDAKGMFERWGERQNMSPEKCSSDRDTSRADSIPKQKESMHENSRQSTPKNITSEKIRGTTYVGGDGGGERSIFSSSKSDVRSIFSSSKSDVRSNFDSKKGKGDK